MNITLNEIRSELKAGTKTVYTETENTTKDITEDQYNNYLSSLPFFRRLGGSETMQKNYTSQGYRMTKLTSKSPNKAIKVVRIFSFN